MTDPYTDCEWLIPILVVSDCFLSYCPWVTDIYYCPWVTDPYTDCEWLMYTACKWLVPTVMAVSDWYILLVSDWFLLAVSDWFLPYWLRVTDIYWLWVADIYWLWTTGCYCSGCELTVRGSTWGIYREGLNARYIKECRLWSVQGRLKYYFSFTLRHPIMWSMSIKIATKYITIEQETTTFKKKIVPLAYCWFWFLIIRGILILQEWSTLKLIMLYIVWWQTQRY